MPGMPDQNVYLAPRQAQRLSRHIGRFVPDRLRLRQRTDDLRTTARTLPSLIRQSGHALFWNPWGVRRHAHLALVHTSIEHSRDWCRSLLILNCQELAAQQPLRPINWCSRLLKMTSSAQPVRELDHRPHDSLVTGIIREPGDKGLVDFQCGDGEGFRDVAGRNSRCRSRRRRSARRWRARRRNWRTGLDCRMRPIRSVRSPEARRAGPISASTRFTSSSNVGPTWLADTLMARRNGCHAGPCHLCIWRQASPSTHAPISGIRPNDSASGRNWPGGNRPSLGCRQRINASAPAIR